MKHDVRSEKIVKKNGVIKEIEEDTFFSILFFQFAVKIKEKRIEKLECRRRQNVWGGETRCRR